MTTNAIVHGKGGARARLLAALGLFLVLIAAYQLNRTVLPEGDSVPSENLALALLSQHKFSFDTDHFPEMFKWRSHRPFIETDDFFFMSWKDTYGDRTAAEWRFSGHLEFNGPRYYIVESPTRHQYVSTFGPVPGLLLLPIIAPFYAMDHDLAAKIIARTTIGKLCGSIFVAMNAVLIFWIAERWLSRRRAWLLAAIYGLGTCAWAISSQAIWQQTVDQFFLTLGALFVLGHIERRHLAVLAGLSFGIATACRPTCVFVALCVLVHLFFHHRKSIPPLLAGMTPPLLAIGWYNFHFFGSPFAFAQQLVGHTIALQKTGSPNLWQTPLWLGAAGLLVSPSRGLLVFSPVLGAAFWGAARAFRESAFRDLRPFAVATFATMLVQCKWFDWWGGHAYGYRPWLDVVPFLVLLLVPVFDSLTRTPLRRTLFGAVVAWSVFVQALGAASYDRFWNVRRIYVFRLPNATEADSRLDEQEAKRYAAAHGGHYLGPSLCDVDLPYCRKRLWSLEDNLIRYQMTNFAETRGRREPATFTEPDRWE